MLTIVHHDIRKIANIFLLLGEGPAEYIYDSITEPEKNFRINFTTLKTKFCLSLH